MNTKELTEIVGLSRDTIRFYEREGLTPAVKNGEKHLVDYVRQPDGKSLGTPGQVI